MSRPRDDSNYGLPVVAETEFFIERACSTVVAHDVQECRLAALPLAAHQLECQLLRQAVTLEIGMRADAADFVQVADTQPLAGHGDEPAAVEVAEVLAQLRSANAERPRVGELRQLHGLRGMLRLQRHGVGRRILGGYGRIP